MGFKLTHLCRALGFTAFSDSYRFMSELFFTMNFTDHTDCLGTCVTKFLTKFNANSLFDSLGHYEMQRSKFSTLIQLHTITDWRALRSCRLMGVLLKILPKYWIPVFHNRECPRSKIYAEVGSLGQTSYMLKILTENTLKYICIFFYHNNICEINMWTTYLTMYSSATLMLW